MDTFIGRSQAGFGKFTTSVSVAAVVIGILGYLQLWGAGAFGLSSEISAIEPTLRFQNSWRYGATNGNVKENARFEFDLDADLRPLFNWNTKQVFAYVTVDYETVSPKTGSVVENSVVIWDRIITSPDSADLHLKKTRSKYSAWDLQTKFGGTERKLQFNLRWNVQPHVGLLTNGKTVIKGGEHQLPPPKGKKRETPSESS